MKGPQVSAPGLEYWGGNAIALNRPTLYTDVSLFFSSVWDYVPTRFFYARHMAASRVVSGDHMDPSPRDH